MNKKGNIVHLLIVAFILFIVLFLGMLLAFGGVTIKYVADQVAPELTTLGTVGDANLTEISGYTITPVNNIVQSFTWLGGVLYAIVLIVCIGFAFAFRFTGEKWLAALWIMFMVMLIISSIFISNIYEEFYNDGSEIGLLLHDFVLLSWLILYSPIIFSVIGFLCGIIMFTGMPEEVGGV